MDEKSIRLNTAEVRAVLDGQKTQHSWPIVPQLPDYGYATNTQLATMYWRGHPFIAPYQLGVYCPHGQPGDLLWVKETFAINCVGGTDFVFYRADSVPDGDGALWRSSVHMPRKYSRITLRITEVRVELLQDWRWIVGFERI